MIAFAALAAPADARKNCRKGIKCERSIGNGQAGGGAGFQLSLPWPAGAGATYDDRNDNRGPLKGLVVGGRCGFFYGQGTHRDHGNRYNDDRFAIDFGVCGKSDEGVPILAAHSGKVVDVDEEGEYGNTVVIRSENEDVATRYSHLEQNPEGDQEGAGGEQDEPIGSLGKSGDVADPHLHFAVYTADGSEAVQPNHWGIRTRRLDFPQLDVTPSRAERADFRA